MGWEEFEDEPIKKKSHKPILMLIILFIIVASAATYLIGYKPFQVRKECNEIRTELDKMASEDRMEHIVLDRSLEDSLSTVCDIELSSSDEHSSLSSYKTSNWDLDKIRNGLDNPEALTFDEIDQIYMWFSLRNAMDRSLIHFNETLSDDLQGNCNEDITYYSIYTISFIASAGDTTYYNLQKFIDSCERAGSLTESERKACLISILEAEKNVVEEYSNLSFEGNVDTCFDILLGKSRLKVRGNLTFLTKDSIDLLKKETSNAELKEICTKMVELRKETFEWAKNSDMDFNQKYFILTTLRMQENFFGSGVYLESEISQDLIKNVDPKYQSIVR